jgi:DNA-binding MarR family transcriptional regulator
MSEGFPLFEERARTTDPKTSKKRANDLTKTLKLSDMLKDVLGYVNIHPGKTAKELGVLMAHNTGDLDRIEWPHKCMKRLEAAGYVERKEADRAMTCHITPKGEQALTKSGEMTIVPESKGE